MRRSLIIKLILFMLLACSAVAAEMPSPSVIQDTLNTIQLKYQKPGPGQLADYIPELAKVDPKLFAVVVMTTDGKIYSVGNANAVFPLESVSKPFTYALALIQNGTAAVSKKINLNATGHPFNSIEAVSESLNHTQNPLVNAGAIIITSMLKGNDNADRWQNVLDFFGELSDSKPYLGQAVYHSEMATNQHNQAIAMLLNSFGALEEPFDAVDRYTKACSVMVDAKQLAVMGATLANNGVNPLSKKEVVPPDYVRDVLSQMVTSGLYENSGVWWTTVGIPAKSGVSGVILAVVPGKMAIVVYSPLVDKAGNSVRAQQVIQDLANQWHLHLLGS